VYPSDPEEFPQKFEGRYVLNPQQIVEGVDEVLPLVAEDMVENLLIVVADDLNCLTGTQPEEPKPLSLR
jgi:hypothetical protein